MLRKILPFIFLLISSITNTYAQNKQKSDVSKSPEYIETFKEVKLQLASNKEKDAIESLQKLYKMDQTNANVQYLLGYCYVKTKENIPDAVKFLEMASNNYTKDYDPNSLKETRVSEYVYYYLIIAYSMNGDCDKAEKTLNRFYDVYSYFDEWYLVEGQKWVRECKTKKKKEKPENNEELLTEESLKNTKDEDDQNERSLTAEEIDQILSNPKALEEYAKENPIITEDNATPVFASHEDATEELKSEEVSSNNTKVIRKSKKDKKNKDEVLEENQKTEDSVPSEDVVMSMEERNLIAVKNALKEQEITVRWKQNFGTDRFAGVPTVQDRLAYFDLDKTAVTTKEVRYTTQSALYGVQVGAFLEPKYTKEFKNLKNVEVYVDGNGVFRYVIGRFAYKSQSEKLLGYVKDMGYSDAFIVDINGGNYIAEVVTVDNQNLKRDFKGAIDYRVQIGAFSRDLPENLARHYLELDGIREYYQNGLTVLTIGSFKQLSEAKAYCEKVKAIGVDDAFVVAFNENKRLTLQEAKKLSELIEQSLEDDVPLEQKTKKKGKDADSSF